MVYTIKVLWKKSMNSIFVLKKKKKKNIVPASVVSGWNRQYVE